jgi:hypothetical protein
MRCSHERRSALLGLVVVGGASACYHGLDGDDRFGSADAGGSASGSADDTDGPSGVPGDGELPSIAMSRLTESRLRNAVRDLFSAELAANLELPENLSAHGWVAIGAREIAPSLADVADYEAAARSIAQWAVTDEAWRTRWTSCDTLAPAPGPCAREIVAQFGGRLFRRPLVDDEVERYGAVFDTSFAATGEFWSAFEYPLTAMAMSPNFTHVVEVGAPSGDHVRLTDHELATRLAFLLWDSTPDDALLDAAASGTLGQAAGLEAQIERLLVDEGRLADGVRAFADDLFELGLVRHARFDPEMFADVDDAMLGAMRSAVMDLAVAMTDDPREFLAILDAGFAIVDDPLAGHYGHAAAGPSRIELEPTGLHVGLLTEPGMLAARASYDVTSPTRRGRFIRTRLLCTEIPDPPPDVEMDLPAAPTGTTRREHLQSHLAEIACKGCHLPIDPLGFGLEHFDPVGRIQLEDNGAPVDASGELDGVAFDGARTLSAAVLEHPGLRPCFASHLVRFALGIEVGPSLEWIAADVEASYTRENGDLVVLLAEIARSDAFRFGSGLRE